MTTQKTDSDQADEPATGPEVIARILKTLPNSPGVYRMIAEDGELLYVGKARSLKKRVQSYARLSGHSNRITRMILQTAAMEFVTTATETDALLLEANLIRKLKPRYNVLLRDDKSFAHILITGDHPAPQIVKHRGGRKRKGDYFGPFASAGAVNRTVATLQRAFLLRNCSDSIYESRTRPCLQYQIKRCAAPCTGEISHDDYSLLVEEARLFLAGKSSEVKEKMARRMEKASESQDYERAAVYRDRLQALSHVQAHQGINPRGLDEADVFAAHSEAGQTCIQVFFFRTGQNWGNHAYYPRADKSLLEAEILGPFLSQFYDKRPCPRLILLSHGVPEQTLISDALSARAGYKVRVTAPKRGEKRELTAHALINAREALGRRLASTASQTRLLAGVAEVFGLDEPPERIEIYDNSHIQGDKPVGAMVVAGPEGFAKKEYRKFNIKDESIAPGDDFAMMREVLTRRFSRLIKDGADSNRPDLVLVDGGAGQLSVAQDVLDELGLDDVRLAGIAKGPDRDAGLEHFHMRGRPSFMLEPRNPVLYFVQRLRDEAHRFAIGAHRARRKKALHANPLDEVPGIGPARKRALLRHFGSAKAVSRAGIADLETVDGISAHMAHTIYDHFHESR